MAWKISHYLEKCNNDFEPIEVSLLKQKLANVSCKCRTCSQASGGRVLLDNVKCLMNKYKDTGVQAESFSPFHLDVNTVHGSTFCPSCIIAMKLLYNGTVKILKDVESNTHAFTLSCDKSEGDGNIMSSEQSTSTARPILKSTRMTICEYVNSCEFSVPYSGTRSRVKFLEVPPRNPSTRPNEDHTNIEDFIETLRPPIPYNF